jgi:hypothetical protein
MLLFRASNFLNTEIKDKMKFNTRFDFPKFIISVSGGHCYFLPQTPRNLAMPQNVSTGNRT